MRFTACMPLLQVSSHKHTTLTSVRMCSTLYKEDICQLQRIQTAEQCHVKDLVHSLQQEVARLKSDNAKLHSHCSEKAGKEHMQNVSRIV